MTTGNPEDILREAVRASEEELENYVPEREQIDENEADISLKKRGGKTKKPQRSQRLLSAEPITLAKPQAQSPQKVLESFNKKNELNITLEIFKQLLRDVIVRPERRRGELAKGLSIADKSRVEKKVECPVKSCQKGLALKITTTLEQKDRKPKRITLENLLLHFLSHHPERNFPGKVDAKTLLNVLTGQEDHKQAPSTKKASKKKTKAKKKRS